MAIPKDSGSGFTNRIGNLFARVQAPFSLAPEDKESQQNEARIREMQNLREAAIELARKHAPADAPVTRDGTKVITLAQYSEAAKTLMTSANEKLPQGERPYELVQFFDFSGMALKGFMLRAEDVATIKQEIGRTASAANPQRPDEDVRAFDATERGLQFNNTRFYEVTFIPATTFYDMGICDQNKVSIQDGTFINMGSEQTLTLTHGTYSNLHFENIKNGTVELRAARVEGVTGSGAAMFIVMDRHSILSNFKTETAPNNGELPTGLSIIDIKAAPGATIEHAALTGTTVTPGSSLRGTIWNDVNFTNVGLADVDLSAAQFNGVTWNNQKLDPANGFAPLLAAGVSESQLPKIDNIAYGSEQHKAWVAMAELRQAISNVHFSPANSTNAPEIPSMRLTVTDVPNAENLPTMANTGMITPEAKYSYDILLSSAARNPGSGSA